MCGIAGVIDPSLSQEHAQHLINAMCQRIRHRGPDEQGTHCQAGLALGMRRLSIIDRAGGQQPIFNEDHSILVVFNGEIYNHLDLRARLQARGHHFSTHSDTEVLLHAYEEFGTACPCYLRGMFAFALWDRPRQRLLLARDRFGKKPLHYFHDGQRFLFASEIKALLEADLPRQLNPTALDDYLVYRYVPSPNTLFQGIYKLPAAHTLLFEAGKITLERYWDLPFIPTCYDDEATAIARTHALLQDAVRVRLMSEVPLGAFLSGGIDSSLVVGYMSQMLTQPVKTFSIGFAHDAYNELAYARRVAEHFGTQHHEFIVEPELVEVLPELVWAFDEPFGDSSMLPTYYVSKLARQQVTVVLTGDGGDEIFGGYRHYAREQAISHLPGWLRQVIGSGSLLLPDGMRGKKRLRSLHTDLPTRYIQGTMIFPVGTRTQMYTPEFFTDICQHHPYERQTQEFAAVAQLDVATQMQYVDARNYLVDDILVKVDKASMYTSLEARAPLLDQHLVAYVSSLQPSLRIRHGMLKYLLKRLAADMLPAEIVQRKKQGFTIPMEQWFRHDLANFAQETLESPRALQRGIFNPLFIHRLLKEHRSTSMVNHSSPIWSLLCLELWFQTYMDFPKSHHQQTYQVQNIGNN